MESLSSFNFSFKYLCVIDVLTKYVYVKPLKGKKDNQVLVGFIGIANESNCKANKSWVDHG